MPELAAPSVAVRASFLTGMRAMCVEEGSPTDWLDEAAADFGAFVAARRVVRQLWDVPASELWYVDGRYYIGTVVVRHELTPALRHDGGNIGYHVVPRYRRSGHATAMLAAARAWCREAGMTELLVTCSADNVGSRKVIEANAGVLQRDSDGILAYRIDAGDDLNRGLIGSPIDKRPRQGGVMFMADETAVSYQAAVLGTPVQSSTGATIGTLEHVLAVPELDVFDGIVVATHHGVRFIEADRVTRITRSHLETDLDDEQAAQLPAPDGPPVYHVDALQYSGHELRDYLGRVFGRPHWIRNRD